MNNVERALKKELELTKIHKSSGLESSIMSLCYSAEETGLIGIRIDTETAITIWKLVEIAKKYGCKLPENLRM